MVLQVVGSNDVRLTQIISYASAHGFSENEIVEDLTLDVQEAIEQNRARLVNIKSFRRGQTSFTIQAGLLFPVLALEAGDVAPLASIFTLSRMKSQDLRAAWKTLCGIDIPEETLERIVQNRATLSLILKYAILPIVHVEAEVLREYLSGRMALRAA